MVGKNGYFRESNSTREMNHTLPITFRIGNNWLCHITSVVIVDEWP